MLGLPDATNYTGNTHILVTKYRDPAPLGNNGHENNAMNEAHVTSVIILSEAFRENKPYNFATQNATLRMQELVPIMLKNRLCPPPPEIYSLHRKMSGMFLMASKLKAEIDCSKIYRKVEAEYIELSVNS